MTNNDIREAYDSLTPTPEEKQKMLNAIVSAVPALSDRKEMAMRTKQRKPALIAAMAALVLLLTGCAAAVVLGLKDLKMGEFTEQPPTGASLEQLPNETTVTHDILSLQGFVGSPGYQASQEWNEFTKSFDPDHEAFQWARYHRYSAPEGYEALGCYAPEMVDKANEICKKYNLSLHGKMWSVQDVSLLFDAIGIPGIQKQGSQAEMELTYGGLYEDGSFALRGSVRFEGQKLGDMLNVDCNRKDTFGSATDMISSVDDFEQWHYTTKDGVDLLLALAKDEALMIADREDFFIRVRLINEVSSYLSDREAQKKALEDMSECFDFTVVPQKADPSKLEVMAEDWSAMWEEADKSHAQEFVTNSYAAYMKTVQNMLKDNPSMEKDFGKHEFALADLNGDGNDELLHSVGGRIEHILTFDGKKTSLLLDVCHGSIEIQLCEDGIYARKSQFGPCFSYTFYRMADGSPFDMENGRQKVFDFVEYHDEAPAHWGRSQDGDDIADREITESEAKQIIASYKPIKLDWKPVAEFPMD